MINIFTQFYAQAQRIVQIETKQNEMEKWNKAAEKKMKHCLGQGGLRIRRKKSII